MSAKSICDGDCFHCIFADCVCDDPPRHAEYRADAALDRIAEREDLTRAEARRCERVTQAGTVMDNSVTVLECSPSVMSELCKWCEANHVYLIAGDGGVQLNFGAYCAK